MRLVKCRQLLNILLRQYHLTALRQLNAKVKGFCEWVILNLFVVVDGAAERRI